MSREKVRDRTRASAGTSNTNVTRNRPRSNPCLCSIFQHKCHKKQTEIEPVPPQYLPTQMSLETDPDRTRACVVSSNTNVTRNRPRSNPCLDGFGGLVVSILATGTRVRGLKPGRSRWIFRASGKSSVCLPSEGK